MSKQCVVSISHKYGCGGHEIGEKLSKKLSMEFVDKEILEKVAEDTNMTYEAVAKLDEKPHRKFINRSVKGYSNTPEQNIADLQFAFMKSKAIKDESFVVMGHCGDYIFKEICPCVTIFITGNKADRIKKVCERDNKTALEALRFIEKQDKKIGAYHDYYCPTKWNNADSYDICVNSSVLGIDETVDFLYNYITSFINK